MSRKIQWVASGPNGSSFPRSPMSFLPSEIVSVLSAFAPVFTTSTWVHAQVLLIGAILCPRERTVCACLRIQGLSGDEHFQNFHRVFNRAKWSGLQASKILLSLLVVLIPAGVPVMIVIDETIERRKGKRIQAKGVYRDAVRSSQKTVVKCFGLKWISMMILIPLPWSSRPWALPFLTVLAPSKAANQKAGKRHKTTIDWTIQMLKQLRRWLPTRDIIALGDGGFACVHLGLEMLELRTMILVSRLRLDANLYDPPPPPVEGKRGKNPKKGPQQPSLEMLVGNPSLPWETAEVLGYGQQKRTLAYLSGQSLWYTPRFDPLPIRWVLVVDPEGKQRTEAFFSTDQEMDPLRIIELYVMRWNVEVTFQETRRHLGVETQRQWSDKAIARETPALFGLFSMICLMALNFHQNQVISPASAAWYDKKEVTFSDILTLVKVHIWKATWRHQSVTTKDDKALDEKELQTLFEQLAAAA